MNLALEVLSKRDSRVSGTKEVFVFVVVDLDRSSNYPNNFVCILPKVIRTDSKVSSNFFKIFGGQSTQVAIRLLTNGIAKEDKRKVKAEIEERLKLLRMNQNKQ